MPEFVVRDLTDQDRGAAARLIREFQGELVKADPAAGHELADDADTDAYLRQLETDAEERDGAVLVAEVGSRLVGIVVGVIDTHDDDLLYRKTHSASATGWVGVLYVEREHRNKGIARALLEDLRGLFVERNCTSIRLKVHSKNVAAVDYYKRLGFVESEIEMTLPVDAMRERSLKRRRHVVDPRTWDRRVPLILGLSMLVLTILCTWNPLRLVYVNEHFDHPFIYGSASLFVLSVAWRRYARRKSFKSLVDLTRAGSFVLFVIVSFSALLLGLDPLGFETFTVTKTVVSPNGDYRMLVIDSSSFDAGFSEVRLRSGSGLLERDALVLEASGNNGIADVKFVDNSHVEVTTTKGQTYPSKFDMWLRVDPVHRLEWAPYPDDPVVSVP